ncbi:MAG: HAMP domain-containing protein [Proteobacteria bacterium]|nr:HAMP domain-containing protein [Pseudomonadota bacterium]
MIQNQSLKFKVNFAIIIALLAIAIIFGLVLVTFEMQRREGVVNRIKTSLVIYLEKHDDSMAMAVTQKDIEKIQIISDEILAIRDVEEVSVFDENGDALIKSQVETANHLKTDLIRSLGSGSTYEIVEWKNSSALVQYSALREGAQVIGFWKVLFTLREMEEETQNISNIFLALLITCFFLMSTILKVFMNRWIMTPIYRLQEVMSKVSKGEYGEKAGVFYNDEIGELSGIFNHMSQTLKKNFDEINAYREELELRIKQRTDELSEVYGKLKKLAKKDSTTGALNYDSFEEIAEKELVRVNRYKTKTSIIIVHIKSYHPTKLSKNDDHATQHLLTVSKYCNEILRQCDFFARLEEDQFLIMLPETDIVGARIVAGKLLKGMDVNDDDLVIDIAVGSSMLADNLVDSLNSAKTELK